MFKTIAVLGLKEKYDYEKTFPSGEPCCWTWYEHLGMNLDEFIHIANQGVDMGLVFNGHPIGDPEQMRRVREAGHSVHIITDRSFGGEGASAQATKEFLVEFGYEYDSLHIFPVIRQS